MATVRQALDAATCRLRTASSRPRRDAELLLMYVLGCTLAELLTHPERFLSSSESAQYEAAVLRRLGAEPIQYITGVQEFFGLPIAVSPGVLIPRPETEHLVEAVLTVVHAPRETVLSPSSEHEAPSVADRAPAAPRILDVGTGSGAIAIVLARALPDACITAVDLSAAALEVARDNARRHGVDRRIRFLESDLLQAVQGERFDAIVSNPPYVSDMETLEPQVSNFEPHLALYAGPSGLEVYQRLIPQADRALAPGGWLLLEIGSGQQLALARLLEGWSNLSFASDLRGIPRVAYAQAAGATDREGNPTA